MLSILRISGDSLSPFLQHGDYILVGRARGLLRRLKPGDVVVFRQAGYGVLVKRVQSISADGEELFVVGDHPDSADSRSFGPILRACVTGKMLAAFRRRSSSE
jgi:phage repressor protein C with HTH and peptisase S24 domain